MPQEMRYTRKKGWQTSRKWQGEEANIRAMAAQFAAEGPDNISLTITPMEAGLATLTVNFDDLQDGGEPEAQANGEPEADNDTWTLQGNDYEKGIWSHPSISGLAATANDDYNWLRKNIPPIQKNGTWQDVISAWSSYTWQDSDTTLAIFKLFREGVESYSVSQFVLRRTRTIKNMAQGIISVGNIGKQFTIVQMQATEGLPVTLRFATPAAGGWIKRTPTVNFDGNKVTCDVEYWHADDWSEILYEKVA